MSEPGIDHPEVDGEAQVSLPGRGITVSSRVESVDGDVLALRPSVGEFVDQSVVGQGTVVEVQWQRPDDQRVAPAEVVVVEAGAVLRWRLRMTGPAEVTQRRKAVRGRVVVPVEVGVGNMELKGESGDLSEDGARIMLDGFGMQPEPGDSVDLRIDLEDGTVVATAEVIRVAARGARWSLSTRFVDIKEKDQDRVRRRVFQALREERASKADDSPPDLRG
jgi:c-di-GMP-binding flagellar brake protein YcgR